MTIIKNETLVTFDCDQTLVMHDLENHKDSNLPTFTLDYYGTPKVVAAHVAHVELLKSYWARGYHITVWSNNGWQWAEQIVEALDLKQYVHVIQTKPSKHVDDKHHVEEIVGSRVYIPNPRHQ